jgi:hypothetical protein
MRPTALAALAALTLIAGCRAAPAPEPKQQTQDEAEPETVDIPQTVTELAPGTTPMAERVAVIGLLNKRNGISREFEMRPGQSVRAGDVIIRLRACETSAPHEIQQLTGAFVQLDVRNPQGRFERAFSGWLFKETPSLNLVEHPVYDVWPKSCAMIHPAGGEAAPSAAPVSNRSSAPNSTPSAAPKVAPARPAVAAPPPREVTETDAGESAAESNDR